MADYVAGRGTTGMSIAGLATGILGTLGTLGSGMNLLGGNASGMYEMHNATMHDVEDAQKLAAKDSEIAQLKAERYAHDVEDRAKEYSIGVYKEVMGKFNDFKDGQTQRWADQMVVNSHISDAITALDGKASGTANLVAQITRTAVPQNAICNFGCNCNSCCGTNI